MIQNRSALPPSSNRRVPPGKTAAWASSSSCSRWASVTRARQERRERGLPDPDDSPEGSTLVPAHRTYAGHGRTPGESWLAASIARDIRTNRDTAREALADLSDLEEHLGEW
jgi:hypothetical protein